MWHRLKSSADALPAQMAPQSPSTTHRRRKRAHHRVRPHCRPNNQHLLHRHRRHLSSEFPEASILSIPFCRFSVVFEALPLFYADFSRFSPFLLKICRKSIPLLAESDCEMSLKQFGSITDLLSKLLADLRVAFPR